MTPPKRRWFQFSLRTILLFLIPYAACIVGICTRTPKPLPERSLWADQIWHEFALMLLPAAQAAAIVETTVAFAGLFVVTKIVDRIVCNRRTRRRENPVLSCHDDPSP